ncbi:unnamed protein product [Rhodiola kirilowii]
MKLRYPFLKFKGRIVYSRTAEEVDGAAMQLLKFVETKRREVGHVILGLDIEWRPSFRRGISPGKVAVMQICGDSHHCYVMHIFHSGVPHNLRILLEDPASTKVGVGIGNDSVKLFKDCSISTKDVQDLSKLANRKFGGKLKSWSLRSLIEELMHKQVEKSSAVQLGNWEATYLSELQLHYAALDAYASWSIHQVLDGLPDAPGDDNAKELNQVNDFIHKAFKIKDLGFLKYILGIEVARSESGIFINKRKYALNLLSDAGMMDFHEQAYFRSHDCCPQILRYIAAPAQGLFFNSYSKLTLQAYCDADWAACLVTRRSLTGFYVLLGNYLISWKTKKQTTISRSSAESEYRSMAQTTCELIWLSGLLKDLHIMVPTPVAVYCDNNAALHIARNPVYHERAKHVEVDYHLVRHYVTSQFIDPR